ncbi:hypothetical protein HpNP102_03770 [Helicobacter pylori]
MKTTKVKNKISKTKGSVLSSSLVFKKLSLNKNLTPPTQQNKHRKKKKKETNREKTLCWKEEKGLEVDHVVEIDREVPFIEHIYRSIYAPFFIELVGK